MRNIVVGPRAREWPEAWRSIIVTPRDSQIWKFVNVRTSAYENLEPQLMLSASQPHLPAGRYGNPAVRQGRLFRMGGTALYRAHDNGPSRHQVCGAKFSQCSRDLDQRRRGS